MRNITDIDDKIIAAAKAQGIPWRDIATRYAQENRELMQATGLPVPEEPKASEYLEDIFKLTADLLSRGHAYVASSGDVLYRVAKGWGIGVRIVRRCPSSDWTSAERVLVAYGI